MKLRIVEVNKLNTRAEVDIKYVLQTRKWFKWKDLATFLCESDANVLMSELLKRKSLVIKTVTKEKSK